MQQLHSTVYGRSCELAPMGTRIPPSLKWLIDKRRRLDHEFERLRRLPGDAKRLLQQVEVSLAAIDQALKLHDIQVDVRNIRAVRSTPPKQHCQPRGELTATIVQALKANNGRPMTTTALTACVGVARGLDPTCLDERTAQRLRESVRYRLKNLRKEGVLTSPTGRRGRDTNWALAKHPLERTEAQATPLDDAPPGSNP
jgi:hypothetical protein